MVAILSIVVIQMGIPLFWGNAFKRKKNHEVVFLLY